MVSYDKQSTPVPQGQSTALLAQLTDINLHIHHLEPTMSPPYIDQALPAPAMQGVFLVGLKRGDALMHSTLRKRHATSLANSHLSSSVLSGLASVEVACSKVLTAEGERGVPSSGVGTFPCGSQHKHTNRGSLHTWSSWQQLIRILGLPDPFIVGSAKNWTCMQRCVVHVSS